MYQITKKALSPDAQVENCVRGILDDFNRDPENFNDTLPPAINVTTTTSVTNATTNVTTNVSTTITTREPWKPCEDDVGKIRVNSSLISTADRDTLVANIKDRFKCLYYSYRKRVLGEDPTAMQVLEGGDENSFCGSTCTWSWEDYFLEFFDMTFACPFSLPYQCCVVWENTFLNAPLFDTVKEDKTTGGSGPSPGGIADSFFFDYKYPAKLPSRVDRFKKGWLFDYDIWLDLDSTAENLVIAVFDEFSGCAVSAEFF